MTDKTNNTLANVKQKTAHYINIRNEHVDIIINPIDIQRIAMFTALVTCMKRANCLKDAICQKQHKWKQTDRVRHIIY
jgi:hypothetical protein